MVLERAGPVWIFCPPTLNPPQPWAEADPAGSSKRVVASTAFKALLRIVMILSPCGSWSRFACQGGKSPIQLTLFLHIRTNDDLLQRHRKKPSGFIGGNGQVTKQRSGYRCRCACREQPTAAIRRGSKCRPHGPTQA